MQPPNGLADGLVPDLVGFGRALRRGGVQVSASRLGDAVAALGALDRLRLDSLYWSLRLTLVSRPEEIATFDGLFAAWFFGGSGAARPRQPGVAADPARLGAPDGRLRALDRAAPASREAGADASPAEVLRHKDFALLTPAERSLVDLAIRRLALSRPRRRTRRLQPRARDGTVDLRGTIRNSIRTAGEPVRLSRSRRLERPRRLVLLCDVSGSMEAYTRPMLLFAHTLRQSGGGVEIFAFGTRLTRLTADLSGRNAEAGLRRASRHVLDWSSGTRIGSSLKTFNESWSRRTMTNGAIVIIVSDGWERDEPSALAREMARLARTAYTVIWVNPLKGHPGYEPLAAGMHAALPFVDHFLPGDDLASLGEIAAVISRSDRRHRSARLR